jgi:hypothetical protein
MSSRAKHHVEASFVISRTREGDGVPGTDVVLTYSVSADCADRLQCVLALDEAHSNATDLLTQIEVM